MVSECVGGASHPRCWTTGTGGGPGGGGGEESDFGIDWGFSRRPLTGEGLSSQIISETKRRSQTGYVGVRKLLSRRI